MSLLAKNSVAMNKFPLLCRQVAKIQTLQCSCSGRPTGNGKKLSSSQAQLGRQHAWLLLSFFPFPVGYPELEHCTFHQRTKDPLVDRKYSCLKLFLLGSVN